MLLGAAIVSPPLGAQASAPFDGTWDVVLTCPPHNDSDDDAKGYVHRFEGTVREGRLQATHGTRDQPGWHFVHGTIQPDGSATLRVDGVVNNAKYAIKDAQRGKVYSYRVKARFDATRGIGQRLTGRVCEFAFSRRG